MTSVRASLLASTLLHASAIGCLCVLGAGAGVRAHVVVPIAVQPEEATCPFESERAEPPAVEVEVAPPSEARAEPVLQDEPVPAEAFVPPVRQREDRAWTPARGPRADAWLAPVRPVPPEVQAPVTPARVVEVIPGENPPPDYPWHARRRGLEGTVAIAVSVDAAGMVEEAAVRRSSGHPILDAAALGAVRGWRFRNGPGRTSVEVEFALRDR
jgi:protein TonB